MFIAATGDEHDAHRAALRAWIESAINVLAHDDSDRDRLRNTLALPDKAPSQPPYVLVRVLSVAGEKPWSVQAWLFKGAISPTPLFDDEGSYASAESERLVADLLDAMARHDVSADDALVAFLLPRSLLREEIHRWRPTGPFGAEPALGATYAVTIRSLERSREDRFRKAAAAQWRSLQSAQGALQFVDLANNAAPSGPAAVRITPAVRGGTGLVQRLRRWGISHAVVANESGAGPYASLIDNVLQAGVPVILLVRNADTLSDDDSRELEQLITENPLLELPRRLRERRSQEEERAEDGLGCRVALLWEVADYLPPDQDRDNRAIV